MIPYGRQDVTLADIDAVREVLTSDFLTQGPAVPRFEAAVAERAQVPHAVATNSATSALHVACAALGLGPGDRLWTQPLTFVASANCALYCGADVDFVDIDPRRFTMCPDRLEEKLVAAEREGRLPKVVMPVHMCGQPADMEAIAALKRRFGFAIVEDASHAIGGRHQGRPVGAEPDTDVTVLSFHPVKIITSGEGGMALARDPGLATRMAMLRTHGITRDPAMMTNEPDGPWYYQQVALGWNYRMTDIHAALGLSQFSRLDAYVARRNELANRYDRAFESWPLTTPWRAPDCLSAFHLYVIRLHDVDRRREAFDALRAAGIGVNVHYIPVHLQPYYRKLGFALGDFPESEAYYRDAITLPLYPTMTEEQQDEVIAALGDALDL
jgi:UDP-4-amino-4,6-dideoxy-N-acetyl-beta-L-altrosamine transaminase